MRKQGNGEPEVCAQNIVSTVRGEIAYNLAKGIDRSAIDRPPTLAVDDIRDDVEQQLDIFEPRVELDGIAVTGNTPADLNIEIKTRRKDNANS